MERAIHQTVSSYVIKRRDYYADFVTVPAATSVACAWLFTLHIFQPLPFFAALASGFVAWSFLEYAMHRWVFHGLGDKEHRVHHVAPQDFIGFTPVTTALIGALAFWVLTVTFGPLLGVGLLVGLVVGYLFYLAIHDKVHHGLVKSGTYLAKLNANHDHHHRRFKVNFGVISPVWDWVFGTYEQASSVPANER